MRKAILSTLVLSFLLAGGASAATTLSSFYVIPFANHIPRLGGETELTDVVLSNYQANEIRVSLILVSYGLHNTANNILPISDVVVGAGRTVLITDVLSSIPGEYAAQGASLGAILVASDTNQPFAVTSRSYVRKADGTTVGYTVPAVADFLVNSTQRNDSTVTAYIPGIRNNDRYRTQVGFVIGNAETNPAFIEFTLRDANGTVQGTRSYYIEAGTFAQLEFPSTLIADRTFDIASIQVRVIGGGEAIAYAKVIDRTTQDGEFILAIEPGSTSGAQSRSQFRALMKGVRAIQ